MEYELTEMEPSGRVLPLFRGDYVGDTVYENPDIVLYNNSSYVAKRTTIGNPPPTDALSDDNWQMVAKGIIDADISTSIVQFNEAKSLENIESSETVETAFGKIKKALAEFIGHYTQKATATIIGHIKLSNSAAITKAGEYALDAIEKNASIEGTLAHLISSQNTVLTNNINQINSNMAGIKVFFDIKSINTNLDWTTATFNDIYVAMPNASVAFLSFETDAQVLTEHGFNNGGAIVFYKGTPWRGVGILSIYNNSTFMMANVISRNTLVLHQISFLS